MARPKLYMRHYGESTGIGHVFPLVRATVEAGRIESVPEDIPDRSFPAFFDSQWQRLMLTVPEEVHMKKALRARTP
ncbi:MAG: hypothetical protein ACREXU_09530 [Gammaproteobacteria bacterium]